MLTPWFVLFDVMSYEPGPGRYLIDLAWGSLLDFPNIDPLKFLPSEFLFNKSYVEGPGFTQVLFLNRFSFPIAP